MSYLRHSMERKCLRGGDSYDYEDSTPIPNVALEREVLKDSSNRQSRPKGLYRLSQTVQKLVSGIFLEPAFGGHF